MLNTLAFALFTTLLAPPQQAPDTTITVPAGERLDVYAQGGEIVVDTWDRDEVRVQASYGSRDEIEVRTAGSVVRVRSEGRFGGSGIVEYVITVPAAMDLELEGLYTDITVNGSSGQVNATTVQGDIAVTGGAGRVELTTVQGSIRVDGADAAVEANSVAGEIRIRNVRGPVETQSVSGRIVLENVTSSRVGAGTVSGRVFFDGPIADGGNYSFITHSGQITIAVPPPLDATVSVAVISGSFSTTLPNITTNELRRGRRDSFTSGNGSAQVEVESFSGSIRLVGRGEVEPPGSQ